MSDALVLALLFAVTALLYASVGQAGATGYLAIMGAAGLPPATMKPTALALNLVVAAIAAWRFSRAGLFRWRTFYPFGVLGFPFSLLGGAIDLPPSAYYPAVGAVLAVAALLLVRSMFAPASPTAAADVESDPPFVPALLAGAGVGLLSGMMGAGGGVFLAPLIVLFGWASARRTAAISAAYNLLNSAAALAGAWATLGALPPALPGWMVAAACGGAVGAWIGARYLPERALRGVLAAILLAASVRMLFG